MPEETEDTTATTADVTPTVPEWRAGLPEEVRNSESVTKFDNSENPLHSLVNGLIGAEKALGSNIALPAQGATDEERRTFWSAIGCPESTDGYAPPTDNVSEHFDADLFDSMREDAHRLGVTPQQLAGLARSLDARGAAKIQQVTGERDRQIEQWHTDLRQHHGEAFDQNMELVANLAQEFGGDEFVALLNETGLNNHPVMVNTLSKLARTMTEDEILGGGGAQSFTNTPDQASAEWQQLQLDKDFMDALMDANHVGHKAAFAKQTELHKQMLPGEVPA